MEIQFPNENSPSAAADNIKQEFAKHVPIDKNAVLDKIISSNPVQEWVRSSYGQISSTIEVTDFNWYNDNTQPLRRKFSAKLLPKMLADAINPSKSLLSGAFDAKPSIRADIMQTRNMFVEYMSGKLGGELELLDQAIANISLIYEQDAVVIFVQYEFKYRLSCTVSSRSGESEPLDIIKEGFTHQSYRVCSVPLYLLKCWMRGTTHDPAQDIARPNVCNPSYVQYGSEKYPSWICKMFISFGYQTFKVFHDAGFVDDLVYKIISEDAQEPETQVGQLSTNRFAPGNYAEDRQVKPLADQQVILDKVEAVKIAKSDREKIQEIAPVDQELSYSEWAEVLDMSKTGAFDLLHRFEKNGLVILTPVKYGVRVILTQKGKRIAETFV